MANLIVDIGNSSCKVAYAQGSILGKSYRYNGTAILDYIKTLTHNNRPEVIIISSVREKDPVLVKALTKECDQLVVLDGTTPIPIKNLYSTPLTLGSDRVASAVAAHGLFPGKDCIIFDFGTAITIDFLNKEGEFLGGNISLGLRTRFKAINHYTKQLPLLDNPSCIENIGSYTAGAIESGIILGIMFEVEGYINKYPDHIIIFTGGDSIYFAQKMKSSIFVVYNLVLMGLAQIAEYNAKK